jgi:hypothetical protein
MNARDWTTLVMRLVGVVLIGLTILPLVTALSQKLLFMTGSINISNGSGLQNVVGQWMREIKLLIQLGFGLYFLFGGKWVIKVLFRGLGGKAGYCPHCDYDVRGIASDRCPECGKRLTPEGT